MTDQSAISRACRDAQERISEDTLFNGDLVCRQYVTGYRFSIDAVLLAHFPVVGRRAKILYLGSGCGVVGLIMMHRFRHAEITVTGIERQHEVAELARMNIRANRFQDRYRIVSGDVAEIRRLIDAESYTMAVANPPFFPDGSGRVSAAERSRIARHQADDGLESFVEAAAYGVKNRGSVVMVFDAGNFVDLVQTLQQRRLTPKRLQFVYSYPEQDRARLVLVEAVKNGGPGLSVLAPRYVFKHRNGPYTEAVEALFSP